MPSGHLNEDYSRGKVPNKARLLPNPNVNLFIPGCTFKEESHDLKLIAYIYQMALTHLSVWRSLLLHESSGGKTKHMPTQENVLQLYIISFQG